MEEMTGTNGHGRNDRNKGTKDLINVGTMTGTKDRNNGRNDRNKGTQDLINVGGEESSSGESSGKEANLVFWDLFFYEIFLFVGIQSIILDWVYLFQTYTNDFQMKEANIFFCDILH